jgi:hypothetical protein
MGLPVPERYVPWLPRSLRLRAALALVRRWDRQAAAWGIEITPGEVAA